MFQLICGKTQKDKVKSEQILKMWCLTIKEIFEKSKTELVWAL